MLRVLIPAHNEARSLDRCLDAVGDDVDVTVVAHRCADATAAIATARGAHVVACDDDGGKLAALRAGLAAIGPVDSARPVVLLDADVIVGRRTLADLAVALSAPGTIAACPPLAPVRPRRRTPLSWALHRYNAMRGFSSARRWLSGRCVALSWLELPSVDVLEARAAQAGCRAAMLAEDIWLSRAIVARGGEAAIAHVATDAVAYRAPETLVGMYRTWRRLRREIMACATLFPELPVPPTRSPDLARGVVDHAALAIFRAALTACAAYGSARDAFGLEEPLWAPVEESKA